MSTAYVTHPRCIEHHLPGHPEHPGRVKAIWDQLKVSGLLDRLTPLTPDPISDDLILSVHTQRYLETLRLIEFEEDMYRFDADTYAFQESPHIARLSAGGAVLAVDSVMRGEHDNALVVTRPPGHHAIPERAMGFCLLGNVAIAAKHAINTHGAKRVMIVDYDVHHGNGTQDMFYEDDNVLFVSTHQYPFYPGSGGLDETGKGKGRGCTINVPLYGGHGDNNYRMIFEEIIWKLARRFRPDLILVSAGFDAHWIDPLASMNLTLTGYTHISRELKHMADELCNGKIAFVLEGGYDLGALSYGMANVARVLLNDDSINDPLGQTNRPEPDIQPLLDEIKRIHHLG